MESMDASPYSQGMSTDGHYSQQATPVHPSPTGQQQPWAAVPHLLQQTHGSSPFQSPAVTSPQLEAPYSRFFHGQPGQPSLGGDTASSPSSLERNAPLSLNISSLSVTSPTNVSPITPSPIPSSSSTTTTISPVTPLSPSSANTTPQQNSFLHTAGSSAASVPSRHPSHQLFSFGPGDHQHHSMRYDHGGQYDLPMHHRSNTSSRSSSSSDKSIPRKRSFTGSAHALPVSMEESIFETVTEASQPYGDDDVDLTYAADSHGSPIEGSSSGGDDDPFKPSGGTAESITTSALQSSKTNNFVSKLYQMITDPKASNFITWNEHGSSFIVSNVGEFSRSILGSHFKHSNFSSFVRQLNMYGFHKINRTPRAQRTSTESQTWEFSHGRFLRDRPDLLEEIKRKTLEPDPTIKQRVELPGEIAAQLNDMREQHRKTAKALDKERDKVNRLTAVIKGMHEFMAKVYPGQLPAFPHELWPSIYVTSPTGPMPVSRYQNPVQPGTPFHHTFNNWSPNASPTTHDFPPPPSAHGHHPHPAHHQQSLQYPLSRTTSMQHLTYEYHSNSPYDQTMPAGVNGGSSSPISSIGSYGAPGMDNERKRPRTEAVYAEPSTSVQGSKRMSRARSDSAPLGYGAMGTQGWPHGNRPRSGSTLAGIGPGRSGGGRRVDELLVNISGSAQRSASSAVQQQSQSSMLCISPIIKTDEN